MNNRHIIILFSLLAFSYQVQAQTEDSNKTYLSIVIPQRSGLASADFKHYRVNNDSLYVLYQPALDTTGNYRLLESYPINKTDLKLLDSLLAQTDSLGHHTSGIFIMGWPRFLIYAKYQGKEYDGYIANCYREHIFVFIDWLNKVYPSRDVIDYSKDELINQEREEELEREKRVKNE
jgi:hypothetical protein